MRRSAGVELGAVGLALLCGALLFTWPLAADPAGTLPGPGDSKYNSWVLGWVAERTKFGLAGVWDTPIFFPYRNTLSFSEPLLGIAVPLAPAYWLGANAILLHNLAVWASFVIAGAGGYVLARDLTGSRAAGVVCGAIAAFLPYRLSHLSHVQVLMGGWLWWCAWAIHAYFAAPTAWRAVRVAALYAALSLSSLYWLYIGVVPLTVIALVEAVRRESQLRTWSVHALLAASVCAAVLLPVAVRLRAMTTASSPIVHTVDRFSYSADLSAYASVHPHSLVWGSRLPTGTGEADLFFGATTIACAALALLSVGRLRAARQDARSWILVYAALLLSGILLSLGPTATWNGHVLFENRLLTLAAEHLPGFSSIRAPARFALIAQLGVSVLAAFGVAALLARAKRTAVTRAATVALATAVFVEGMSTGADVFAFTPFEGPAARRVTHWLSERPGGAVLDLPLDGSGPVDYSILYQARTLVHHHPIPQGTSRYTPPLVDMLRAADSPLLDPDRVSEAIPFLRHLGIRYVVVQDPWYKRVETGTRIRHAFAAALGRTAASFGQAAIFDLGAPVSAPPLSAAPEIRPSDVRATASSGDARLMLDGDLATAWQTTAPQQPGDQVELTLGVPVTTTGIRLRLARDALTDYPRHIEVLASDSEGGALMPLISEPGLPSFGFALNRDPVAPVIEFAWAPTRVRRVVLRQTGHSTRAHWTIHEARLLGLASR